MINTQTTSPGYARTAVTEPVSLEELPWCGKINLRGNPENQEFMDAVHKHVDMTLPLTPHSCSMHDQFTGHWLGPNEWLVYCPIESVEPNIAQLKSNLQGIHSAVVDVSDYYTVLRLCGDGASELLMKACPLDLHPSQFPTGSSTQTRFGHASILLHKTDSLPAYDIQVRWSYTEYLWDYLVHGMKAL